jgi:23S rRNA (uracil1939-C5)-methyltransferase
VSNPTCPHYPQCVGCGLIGTPYGQQLERKHARVVDSLAAYPRLAATAVPPVIGAVRLFGYRNQVKLVVRRARRGLLLGVYRPGTHQVVDIAQCPVHQEPINSVLAGVRQAVERSAAPVYDERSGEGWLRYVVVRASAWKKNAQIILVVRDRRWSGEGALLRQLRRIRGVASVVLNLNATTGNAILGERFIDADGDSALIERVGALKLSNRAGAFMQAHTAAARRAYEHVLRWADPRPEDTAVDLYAGVGAISFYLAGAAGFVVGVEESPRAVLDAKRNIRLNGYHNVRFIAAPAAQGLAQAAAQLERVDVVTLNPPRQGAAEDARRAIVACSPSRVVYMSCDPVTLARDLDWFRARGYALAGLQPYDLLPQTEHVETVALLRRKNGEPVRRCAGTPVRR